MVSRYPILNIWTDGVNKKQALDEVDLFIRNGKRLHTIFAANPEKNYSVPKDPDLYKTFREADLLLPDGIGIVLAAKLLYGIKIQRVPGCEFMQNVCLLAQKYGYKIYIYGAKELVNKGAVKKLRDRLPGIKIVGHCHGYWPENNMDQLVRQINESGAQILFLALGSPKQERWIARYRSKLNNVKVCQGIGGTLDVINGNIKRAPDLFCHLGIEWLYRLIVEPKRIKRQKVLPLFTAQILGVKIRSILTGKNPGKVG
jgi:N-acetylglucosaminyldiphosphoundecaprenol N-acetyl-beta-D-mannosaminyltransferase